MKLKLTLFIIPIAALLTACGQSEVTVGGTKEDLAQRQLTEAPTRFVVYPDDRPSVPDGKVVYDKMQCATCHGMDGNSPAGSSAKISLSNKLWMREQKPADEYIFLTYGDSGKGHDALRDKLSRREIWDLVFYTRTFADAQLTQAECDAILPVFGANCAVCHGTKGDGDGPLAHNLEPNPANFQKMDRFFDRTDATLFDHIANGIKWEGMPNFLGKEDRKNNVKFDETYIRKLVQYVRRFHESNEPTTEKPIAAVPVSDKNEKKVQ